MDDDDEEEEEKEKEEEEEENFRMHMVNCVSAQFFCYRCIQDLNIDEVTAKTSTSNCEYCSTAAADCRMRTWINGVDHCPDALHAFVVWLINGLPGGVNRSMQTIAIGHYCGRFAAYMCPHFHHHHTVVIDMIYTF